MHRIASVSMGNDEDLIERFEIFSDKIKKCLKYVAEPYLEKEGLRIYHAIFLRIIESEPGASQKSIKARVPYDKSRVSMVITELLELGLVRNTSSGKLSSLVLTDKGTAVSESTKKIFSDFRRSLFSDLSEEEFVTFIACMDKFDRHLDGILSKHSRSDEI